MSIVSQRPAGGVHLAPNRGDVESVVIHENERRVSFCIYLAHSIENDRLQGA